MAVFNEDNPIEQMIISTLKKNGWKYIPAEELDREESDVMVESMVREALIRLNPEIAQDESRAGYHVQRCPHPQGLRSYCKTLHRKGQAQRL